MTYRGEAKYSGDAPKAASLVCHCTNHSTVESVDVMPDVEYVTTGGSTSSVDIKNMFSSNLQGAGLIFISPYGVRPLRSQDLRTLKSDMRSFVVDGKLEATSSAPKIDSRCNTSVRKDSFGLNQVFLYLDQPIEKGQCVELCFKDVNELFHSGSYRYTQSQLRHLLDEAFAVLSCSDLRSLISFLGGEILDATNFSEVVSAFAEDESGDANRRLELACSARRRMHWLALKIQTALQEWTSAPGAENASTTPGTDPLYFGPLLTKDEKILPHVRRVLAEEVRQELHAGLELDEICGAKSRHFWCPLFHTTLQRVVDCIVDYYVQSENPSPSAMLETLATCVSSCISVPVEDQLPNLVLPFKPSDLRSNTTVAGPGIREAVEWIRKESGFAEGERIELVACSTSEDADAADGSDPKSLSATTSFQQYKSLSGSSAIVSKTWYREHQWKIVMTVVAKAGILLSPYEKERFMHPRALFELKQKFLKESGLLDLEDASMETLEPMQLPKGGASDCEPHAYPLFLGMVWPKLRALGWRLEAGESPKDVTFVAPDTKALTTKRANPWKQRRDLVRLRLSRDANRSGLGNLTKLTKRLFVCAIPHPDGGEVIADSSEAKGVATAVALRRFLQHVESQLEADDENGRRLAFRVVALVRDCFDELAPKFDASNGEGKDPEVEVAAPVAAMPPPSESYGCDFLLRFLLVLPSILRQSDLVLQEINDCLEIIRELVDWMSVEYPKLLYKKYQPTKESYVPPKQPKQTPPELSQRLRILYKTSAATAAAAAATKGGSEHAEPDGAVGSGENALVMKELIRPEDKPNLTDFLVMVLDQAMPCRATEHDVEKKYRRINVGFPGFVCRHCRGDYGEGRYFFSTIESLTTASTVFEKHVGKCKSVPEKIKAAIVDAKTRHVEQRKHMPVGAQQAYFNRLWDRLRASQIEGAASGTYVLEGLLKKDVTSSSESSEDVEFRDHISLLDYLRTHVPSKANHSVMEALNQYYGCLDYGGRVFYTSSMPNHFSAEWLMRKVGPKPKRSRKKRLMPG